MNKSVLLNVSILDTSKIAMYKCWYNYIKPDYGEKAKLCYTDTDSVIACTKAKDIYTSIVIDMETRFNASIYELNRKNITQREKKLIGLMKNGLGGKIMTKSATLKPQKDSYLADNSNENKKAKGTKVYLIKRKLKIEDYKNCLKQMDLKMK